VQNVSDIRQKQTYKGEMSVLGPRPLEALAATIKLKGYTVLGSD
jgi:hypothetical protein